ncbi:MAG: PilZ domain-containing protein [Cyanobacteriota bacterium]|nr:PilZ domain-containing protein [Cyanobacteriota bacterium]
MAQSHLPKDPLAASEVVMQRAELMADQRRESRRKPLPEQAQAELSFVRRQGLERIQAEVLDLSSSGMRLAAFANEQIQEGDRCEIAVHANGTVAQHSATVRWVKPHPMIQVFGVQFD